MKDGKQLISFFCDVKIKTSKGEALIIESDKINLDVILKYEKFLVPIGSNKFWFGSVNKWNPRDGFPSMYAYKTLEKKIKKICPFEVKVVNQKAGIRSSTNDQKPIFIKHQKFPNLYR